MSMFKAVTQCIIIIYNHRVNSKRDKERTYYPIRPLKKENSKTKNMTLFDEWQVLETVSFFGVAGTIRPQ